MAAQYLAIIIRIGALQTTLFGTFHRRLLRYLSVGARRERDVRQLIDSAHCPPSSHIDRTRALVHKPRALVRKPRALVRKPRALVRKPRALVHKPRALVRKPRALVRKPRALVRKPRALVRKPRALVRKPRALVRKPRALVRKSRALVRKPRALVSKLCGPISLNSRKVCDFLYTKPQHFDNHTCTEVSRI